MGTFPPQGTLENKPGCNAEQTLEALVNGELGRIRDLVGGVTGGNLAAGICQVFVLNFPPKSWKSFFFMPDLWRCMVGLFTYKESMVAILR